MGLFASVRSNLDAFARPLAPGGVVTFAGLLPGLFGGLIVLAVLSIYLAERGMPGLLEAMTLVWLAGPVVVAHFVSRGRLRLNDPDADLDRRIAGSIGDVITRHDRNGWVLSASAPATKVFGAALEELQGRGLFDRMLIADRPAYLSALWDAATSHQTRSVEFRVRRGDAAPGSAGGVVWIEMRCAPLERTAEDGDGERDVVAVMRDITRRKQEERAREDAHAEAERASPGKSRFLATMSHELRTPLNAIIGFSEMLLDESGLMIDAKRRHDYARLINESGHHLLSVVNGILDMSKIEAGNFELTPEPVETARVIGECCDLLALRAREAGIDLAIHLPADLPRVVADKRALHQIMLNLLANAVKFTNRGGKVTVTAAADARSMTVCVEDTGVGIGADDLPRVGEPFFQARSSYDRRHDGTGLGVSIVKGLLALHGGWLEIVSRLGEGTRVTVRLPLDCEGAQRLDAPLVPARPEQDCIVARPDRAQDMAVMKSA